MKSSATATIEFSFRGKTFTPSIRVDLDPIMKNHSNLKAIYDMIAASIGMDAYTYEYDVLIMEEIVFSDPEGPVSEFIHEGSLDFDGFRNFSFEQGILDDIKQVAKQQLGIENLDEHPQLKKAFIESYRLGQRNPDNKVEDYPLL